MCLEGAPRPGRDGCPLRAQSTHLARILETNARAPQSRSSCNLVILLPNESALVLWFLPKLFRDESLWDVSVGPGGEIPGVRRGVHQGIRRVAS